MATWYYNLAAGSNGTGTPGSPFNIWPGATVSAGDSHLFMRGTTATVAFAISSGGAGAITRYGAWFNGDGSDDTSQPRPVIGTSVVMSTFATKKGHFRMENLDIRGNSLPVASDSSMLFLSDSATIVNCLFQTNIGGIGIWGGSNITIQSANVQAVSHIDTSNNNILVVAGTTAMTAINVTDTGFIHLGGGGTGSHAVVCGCDATANSLSNFVFRNNAITTVTLASNSNTYAIGLRTYRCPSADISFNIIRYHLTGIFMTGGGTATAATIAWNTCERHRHFGIHLTTDAIGCLIEHNTCRFNGTDQTVSGLMAYGRGIEVSGAAGQSRCASHVIRYNTCTFNYNYGGPNDNGSEGVGIGLDDGAVNCTVYANTCTDNEGNGIQLYGGGNTVTWTDTHNHVFSNLLRNNCTASFTNRRAGGTTTNLFNADIALGGTYGGFSYVANNTFASGTSPVGISTDVNCSSSISYANNIFISYAHPIMDGRGTVSGYEKNCYYNATQIYSGVATNGGSAAFNTIVYTGTNDFTFNPAIDSNFRLTNGSSAISAGTAIAMLTTIYDYEGKSFFPHPSLGAVEFSGQATNFGGHDRKHLFRNR